MIKTIQSTAILLLALSLTACGQSGGPDKTVQNDASKKGAAQQGSTGIEVYEPRQTEESNSRQSTEKAELSAGEFYISTLKDGAMINANQVPKRNILNALADQFDFSLKIGEEVNGVWTAQNHSGSVESILKQLLDGMAYSISYTDLSPSMPPEIDAVSIGHNAQSFLARQGTAILPSADDESELSPRHFELGFPFLGESSYPGAEYTSSSNADLDIENIVSYGSQEQIIELVNEIDLDSQGIRTLATLLRDNSDPQIRAEVVSALSNSDSFASQWIILSTLKDADDQVALAALEAIEIWQDPSTLPYVRAYMQRTGNQEAIALAQEIVEFNSNQDTRSYTSMTPQQIETQRRQIQLARQRVMKQRIEMPQQRRENPQRQMNLPQGREYRQLGH